MKKSIIYDNANIDISIDGKIVYVNKKLRKHSVYHGYNMVRVNKKRVHVHKLVALAYVPNPDNNVIVVHIDKDKTNNHATNLKWLGKDEKLTRICKNHKGKKVKNSKLTRDEVLEIVTLYKEGKHTQEEIAKMYNVTHPTVNHIVNGKSWNHVTGVNNDIEL